MSSAVECQLPEVSKVSRILSKTGLVTLRATLHLLPRYVPYASANLRKLWTLL